MKIASIISLWLLGTGLAIAYQLNIQSSAAPVKETEFVEKAVSTVAPSLEPQKQPTPTSKPKVNTTPTYTPERKKLLVTFNDYVLSGTFYCYEDKINTISTAQNDLSLARNDYSNCLIAVKNKNSGCRSDCLGVYASCSNPCVGGIDSETRSACYKECDENWSTCNNSCDSRDTVCSTENIVTLANQLLQQKKDYCP